ncbi:hypothetical protein ABZV77_40640 [Streptomyces sp. NPDC004732]|uniref:hypothetical protein n=1 Tax=Streptomyces sp. NPDC004732 TaxID=3154290 RepID=UPI0033B39049
MTALPLAARLTEYLDRAAHVYGHPLHIPRQADGMQLPGTAPSPAQVRPRTSPAWMDAEARAAARWRSGRTPAIRADQLTGLGHIRREVMSQRLQQLDAHGRVPRVCLYGVGMNRELSTGRVSLDAAFEYAGSQGWRVRTEHAVADLLHHTAPAQRPWWRWVLRQVRAGHADGVVVLAYEHISPHLDEYEQQLDLMAESGGFVALVSAENSTGGQR